MKKWQTEDEIRTELRDLTTKVRRLRGELEEIIKPVPDTVRERRYLHTAQSGKASAAARSGAQRRKKRER